MNMDNDNKIYGVITGTVVENYNPDYLGKIKVTYSFGETGKNKSGWIPVAVPYVSQEAGMYFFPEMGTEVLISFILGNINRPVVVGSLWNNNIKTPKNVDFEKNTIKMIHTKAGHKIIFNEEPDKETIEIITKKGLQINLTDSDEKATITDNNKKTAVTVDFKNGSIDLNADKKVTLSVGGTAGVTVESNSIKLSSGSIEIKGTQSLKTEGQTTSINGSSIEISAQGSLKASSSGIFEAKGSLIKLN